MNAPSRLGRYEIRGELGRGAMGVVLDAFDPAIGRAVAIKLLQGEVADVAAAELRVRFQREAQAAGRLGHPNIVGVYEYGDGQADERGGPGQPYIVMERVAGRTLKAHFDAGHRFPLDQAVRLMGDLLAALEHAHARGVIHRDIKPSNLIVLEDGPTLKVADFGIARIDHSDLTLTGTTLGTTSHMSPEQFLGQPVDRRTDLYACGVVLYQFLTGELPFAGSPSTIMQKVLNQEALAPSMLNPALPRAWDAVVRQALAKRAADRYDSAAAMAAAIRQAAGADPEATVLRPAAPAVQGARGGRRVATGLAAAGVVALGCGAIVMAWRSNRPSPERAEAAPVAASAPAVAAAAAPVASGPAAAPRAEEIEQQAWADASGADTASAYRAFLQAFPKSPFAGRARVRLAVLEPRPAAPAAGPAAAPARPASTARASAPPASAAAPASLALAPEKTPEPSRQACLDNPNGDRRCALILGYFYRSEAKDFAAAMTWFRRAAEQGEVRGQYEVAMLYFRGQGVARDDTKGFELMKKAAVQGFAMAQNRIGVCFERGEGVAKDIPTAVDWYRKSAAQGEPFGQNNLGRMLLWERSYPHDAAQAYELFGRSAAQGNPYAAYNLAYMFENGVFVTADKRTAARWYRTSLGNGLETATMRDGGSEIKNLEHARAFVAANP